MAYYRGFPRGIGGSDAQSAALMNRMLLNQDPLRGLRPGGREWYSQNALPPGEQAWQPSRPPLWDTIEQKLKDILENPPKFYVNPQTQEQERSNQLWEALHAPQVLSTRMRSESDAATRRLAMQLQQEEKGLRRKEGAYKQAVSHYQKVEAAYNKIIGDSDVDPQVKALQRDRLNAAARAVHEAGSDLEYKNLEQTFPEVGETGRPQYIEREIAQLEERKRAEAERVRRTAGFMGSPEANIILLDDPGIPTVAKLSIAEKAIRDKAPSPQQGEATVKKIKEASKDPEERLSAARQVIEGMLRSPELGTRMIPGFEQGVTPPLPPIEEEAVSPTGPRMIPGFEQPQQIPAQQQETGLSDILERLRMTTEETSWRQPYRGAQRSAARRTAYPHTSLMERYRQHLQSIGGGGGRE